MSIKLKQGRDESALAGRKQGDREGRPYTITKQRLTEDVYSGGDLRGRPASRERKTSYGRPEMIEQDLDLGLAVHRP